MTKLVPILKWVGGKRQLLNEIIPMIPSDYSTYVEPFIGGGAVLFELQPKKAIINDCNSQLMNVYTVIKHNSKELVQELQHHEKNNTAEHFYMVRGYDRKSDYFNQMTNIQKAGRIIYLNKTCYNGLYRVNSKGQFNSPYGKYKNPNIVNEHVVRAVSKYFNESAITIGTGDYKAVLRGLDKSAFVYLDPPYMVIQSTSFISYNETRFDKEKQIELKEECDKLNKKGIKFLQSNSDCEFIRELYKDYKIKQVKANRSINSKGTARNKVNELLIYNY